MEEKKLSVRPLEINDLQFIVDYFLKSDTNFLLNMGVEISKLPSPEEWLSILTADFYAEINKKAFFYIIWLVDDEPIGHCNINKIDFGKEAYMHIHIWQKQIRKKGIGLPLIKLTLHYFFDLFKLKTLYCEPYALNVAPNKTLEKLGFDFIKAYETIPGWISFHQLVNRWCLTNEKFKLLNLD